MYGKLLSTLVCVASILQNASMQVAESEKVCRISGDVTIGGLVPIYQSTDHGQCNYDHFEGAFGMLRLEAMIDVVKKINKDPFFEPVKLGLEVRDSCNFEARALEESLNFVIDKVPGVCEGNQSFATGKSGKLAAVIGATKSSVTAQVAKLLRLFKIPQISYASTSEELSDKTKYAFLLRTVPSDKYQAKAMADFIADELKWKSVYGILEEGSYGENGMQKFKKAAGRKGICVVDTKVVTKTMQGSLNRRLNEILSEFYNEKKVPGIVLFCHQKIIDEILTVLGKNNNFREHFTWIGSDGWGLHTSARKMKINVTVFSLHAHSEKLGGFHRHYKSLKPGNNSQNPWFDRYWCWQCNKSAVNCPCDEKLNYSPPNEVKPTKKGEGKGGDEGKTEFPITTRPATNFKFCANDKECFRDDKVAYVIDAIYAVAHALKKLYQAKCPQSKKSDSKCLKILKVDTTEFFNVYLKNVSFVGKTGRVSFANESLKGVYDISQLNGDTFKKVGTWNGLDGGSLNMTAAWKRGNAAAESQCGKNCSDGEVRKIRNGKNCCWDCIACPKTEKVISLFDCKSCGNGYKQNGTFNGCEKIPEVHWDRGWLVAVSFLASVGCGLSFFVLAVFLRYRATPVIRAASREISYALMFGIILCYSLTFFMAAWPNAFTCGVIRFGTGFSICICYAALLVKTSRIARIFSGRPDPLFITPKWQLVLTGLLVLPQALIGVVGLLVNPPGVEKKFNSIEKTVVHCKSDTSDLIVSISYNLLLILLCTVYAFRTRKVPENFNEARFIGFVMYTTCVIWLAFLPLFYGANWDYRSVALSLHLILNATTILFGLFGMKMYIVLLRPEKNIRANSKARSFSFPSDSNAHTVVNQDTVKDLPQTKEKQGQRKSKKESRNEVILNDTLVSYVSEGSFVTFGSDEGLNLPSSPRVLVR